MINTPQIILFAADPQLAAEVKAALAAAGGERFVLHAASDFRQAVEAVRSRRPALALVEMSRDIKTLKTFSEESAAASPETVVAAVFRPDVFGPDVSESAILIEAIRAGVRDFLRRPISSNDLDQLLGRLNERRTPEPRDLGKVIAIVSNKGGVGKSTVAVNVGCALARKRPGRVLLIDASMQIGTCASMLDLHPVLSITDAARQRDRLDETLLRQLVTPHDSGLHLLAAPMSAMDAIDIDDEIVSRILTLARRTYDFVVVDTFPMIDRVVMAVLDHSDRVYLVLENVVPTLQSGIKLIELLNNLGISLDRQRVVLNRYSTGSGNLKPLDVAQQLGRDVNHVIPYHKKAIQAANTGRPFILTAGPFSSLGRSIRQLVQDIDQMSSESTVDRSAIVGGLESGASVGTNGQHSPPAMKQAHHE